MTQNQNFSKIPKIGQKYLTQNMAKKDPTWPKTQNRPHFGRSFDSDPFWTFSLTFIYGKTKIDKI